MVVVSMKPAVVQLAGGLAKGQRWQRDGRQCSWRWMSACVIELLC